MTRNDAPSRRFAMRFAMPLALLFTPTVVLAHPGHDGGFVSGLLHPIHGLDHLLAALAVGLWAVRLGGRVVWTLPLAFVAAMIVGSSLAPAGIALPATELGIALSVLVLGAAVATNLRVGIAAGTTLVAAFGLFHGAAHGSEAALHAGMVTYTAGLTLATAAMHATGIALAVWLRARSWILRFAAAPIALAGAAMLVMRLA